MKVWIWMTAAAVMAVAIGGMLRPGGGAAEAHHASAPFYDNTKRVDIEGEVTRFLLRNPHSFVYLDAENEDGDIVGWEVEMGTALSMTRRGWTTDTITVGERIKVVGQPSRAPGTYGVCCAELTKPDGSPLQPAD